MENNEKPIISTTFSGLFVKTEPWEKGHVLWFNKAAERLNDLNINKWAGVPNYFEGVDLVMSKLYPELNDKDRTIKARETFFDAVCDYLEKHKVRLLNQEVITYFKLMKSHFRIALITSNQKSAMERVLEIVGMGDYFDIIETSEPHEKDEKILVFNRFLENHGKPGVYIGGGRQDSYDLCQSHNVPCVYANLESGKDLVGVETVRNLDELKRWVENQVFND